MKNKKSVSMNAKFLFILLIVVGSLAFTFVESGGGKRTNKAANKEGDAYRMFINNLDIPLNREGVIADVLIGGRDGGRIDGQVFLFSSGFFMSGITNGGMWANAVASASRIQDYQPGTYESGRNDPRAQIYVVSQKDGDFAQSWIDWKDAVDLGAEFYDGDGDGLYNPVDKNGNGKWDPDEDRPDLIGDETVWCVYHDGVDPALRRFNDVDPQGIEIRQTVFGFASKGVTGNMIFVRYNILNTGLVADVIDSVYFGVWADPDLGDYTDDLVGCDVSLDAGFTYNDGSDAVFGVNPPCFLIDFFQGPVAYVPDETFTDINGNGEYDDGIDVPLDTAYNVRGIIRGVESFPGAKNLGLSSFMHYQQSVGIVRDPDNRVEARNYMLGRGREGEILDPCTWALGEVRGGVDCATIDNRFWYSGDPVANVGWININPTDQRQLSNTGPFQLRKGEPVNIIAAYVVGRGTNQLNSITVTKEYDQTAQLLFDENFPSPPSPPVFDYSVKTGSNFIDLTWETAPHFTYRAVDEVLDIDRRVQGFYVTAFRTNVKSKTVAGVNNAVELANYSINNGIENIYVISGNGGQDLRRPVPPAENILDSVLYSDPSRGRIKLRINQDPFTQSPLIKGHEYYFAITQYTLNHNVIVNRQTGTYGAPGDYFDPLGAALEEFETQIIRVTFGEDLYNPAVRGNLGTKFSGASSGQITYLVVDNDVLTGDEYSVEFFKDEAAPSNAPYTPFWRLRNLATSQVLIDSSKRYEYDTTKYAGEVKEGILVKVRPVTPSYSTSFTYAPEGNVWYDRLQAPSGTGVFYVGSDIPQGSTVTFFPSTRSNAISADRLRKIEIRFGDNGKAYRYLNGYIGTTITQQTSYRFAGGISASDTVGKGAVGNWNTTTNRANGFVDVPFTVWDVDERYGGEAKQLAVGFIERRGTGPNYFGNPDGQWDPGDSIALSREVIMIFDAPYDPSGSQIEYTGGVFGTDTVWANPVQGFTIPSGVTGITQQQRRIAASPWFNSMYVVGFQKSSPTNFFTPGDVFTVPMQTYPYTSADEFRFRTQKAGELSDAEKKALFDKVTVFPNPLFAYNPATSFSGGNPDDPFVTFSNLPTEVSIKIYTLSGTLIRTLTTADKSNPTSPFLQWDLQNEDRLRVASGMYLAIVSAPGFGEKVLKFMIVMPQKQIQRF